MRALLLAGFRRVKLELSQAYYTVLFQVRLRLHGARAGSGLCVSGPVNLYIHRAGRLRIGDRCRLNSGFSVNPVGGDGRLGIWVNAGGFLDIGDGAGLSNATIVSFKSVTIGPEAFIGGGARIYDTDFHPLDASARVSGKEPGRSAPVVIGARAFVGGHALVLKGTSIGEEAIVGAGAVVSGTVPSGEIWAGNPARFVRKVER